MWSKNEASKREEVRRQDSGSLQTLLIDEIRPVTDPLSEALMSSNPKIGARRLWDDNVCKIGAYHFHSRRDNGVSISSSIFLQEHMGRYYMQI